MVYLIEIKRKHPTQSNHPYGKSEDMIYLEHVIVWLLYNNTLYPITCDFENTDENDYARKYGASFDDCSDIPNSDSFMIGYSLRDDAYAHMLADMHHGH